MNFKSKLLVALLATLPVAAYAAPATIGTPAGVNAVVLDNGNLNNTAAPGGLGLAYMGKEWINWGDHSSWTWLNSSVLTGNTYTGNPFGTMVLATDGLNFAFTGTFMGLSLTQTYTITSPNQLAVTVQLANNTGREVTGVQWGVGFDPDVDLSVGGGFATTNTIEGQGNAAAVSAIGHAAQQKVVLANTTTASAFSIAAYINPGNCCTPVDPAVALAAAQAVGFTTFSDDSISLGYNIGTLAAGGVASLGYSYTFLPIPEADTYGMMLAGLGLMGLMARRRQA